MAPVVATFWLLLLDYYLRLCCGTGCGHILTVDVEVEGFEGGGGGFQLLHTGTFVLKIQIELFCGLLK